MMRRTKIIKTGAVLLAVGSVAAAAAPLTWHLRGHDSQIPPVAKIRAQATVAPAAIDVTPVLSLAPFGAVPVAAQAQTVVEDTLNLTLLGVIVRDDPQRSMALIGSPSGEANYRIGDEVKTDVVLTGVLSDYVTLEVAGALRKLTFDGADLDAPEDDVPTGQDRLAALMTNYSGPTISERNDAAERRVPVTTQDYIDLWRKRIDANPQQVLDSIGLIQTDGGYMIAEKHDSGVNRAGLQTGDIVRTLNGQPVGDIESDRVLYDQVAEQGMARIEIERNGRTIVMSFPLR